MNMIMWTVQILLALAFVATGSLKMLASRGRLEANPAMGWTREYSTAQIRLLGVAEVLGGLGLVVPAVTGIAPFLVRVAAVCLATLMGGAVATHLAHRESGAAATVLALMTIAVASLR